MDGVSAAAGAQRAEDDPSPPYVVQHDVEQSPHDEHAADPVRKLFLLSQITMTLNGSRRHKMVDRLLLQTQSLFLA